MEGDVLRLILDYRDQLEQTERAIKIVNERYGSLIGLTFGTFEEVEYFLSLLQTELGRNSFITLSNRCPHCENEYSDGFYTYTDERDLTVGGLLEFCRYLKRVGILCEHEVVDGIQVASILCVIELKCRLNVSENSGPT